MENRKVEQRMKKGKSRIGKAFTQCKKGSAEGKVGKISRKIARNGLKTGKSAKNGDFGAKKEGWCGGEKMGFTTDFAIL